jgi:Tfp pilus assembly protein PilF
MDLVVQVNPSYAKAYIVRASALVNLGLDAQSQVDFDRAVSLGVDRATAETTVEESASFP